MKSSPSKLVTSGHTDQEASEGGSIHSNTERKGNGYIDQEVRQYREEVQRLYRCRGIRVGVIYDNTERKAGGYTDQEASERGKHPR